MDGNKIFFFRRHLKQQTCIVKAFHETDKYFIVLKKQYFKELEADKFSLLDDVKSVNIGNGIPATLSIGLGLAARQIPMAAPKASASVSLCPMTKILSFKVINSRRASIFPGV